MQRVIKWILSIGLAIIMCLGITVIVTSTSTEVVVADTVVDSYYSGITATSGTALLGQVHDLITKTHTKYTSYNDCKNEDTVMKTDPGTANYTVRDFYTQEDISAKWDGNSAGTWNREHVWAQSLSNNLWGTSGGGSDLHHIRPSEVRLNGSRGNHTFGEANGGSPAYYKDTNGNNKYIGGYISGDTFEPLDNVKGDVARIVLYVYTHYNTYSNVGGTTNGSGGGNFGTLKFTNIMSPSSESAAISLLLEWNEADPVDQIEITRNNAVYSIQGNRNPFIDHPEYANAIWGNGSTTTPGGESSGGTTTPPDVEENTNLTQFYNAVNNIVSSGSLQTRLNSINKAITAYNALTADEKSTAADYVRRLQNAIDDYNKTVKAYNDDAQIANFGAYGG